MTKATKRESREEIGVEIEVVSFLGRYYDTKNRYQTKASVCLPHISKIISREPTANQLEEVSEVG